MLPLQFSGCNFTPLCSSKDPVNSSIWIQCHSLGEEKSSSCHVMRAREVGGVIDGGEETFEGDTETWMELNFPTASLAALRHWSLQLRECLISIPCQMLDSSDDWFETHLAVRYNIFLWHKVIMTLTQTDVNFITAGQAMITTRGLQTQRRTCVPFKRLHFTHTG